jgi:2-phosphosulfolactate phosphatase
MYFDQEPFDIRCEWGLAGVETLSPSSDVVIVVDVLSFSTSVDIATARGAIVLPYRWREPDQARAFAAAQGALLAGTRQKEGDTYSLSPASLLTIPAGTRLVLPSPNGATLSLATGAARTFAGCLRNAAAVAQAAARSGRRISVIAAGERWTDGGLRPAIEDLIGAGAIIDRLPGQRSPEAMAAVGAYRALADTLQSAIQQCGSGRELIGRGFARDVELAVEMNVSDCVPVLIDGAYVRWDESSRE